MRSRRIRSPNFFEIDTALHNGRITLSGTVDSWAEKVLAGRVAGEGGAKDVRNELAVTNEQYGPYY